MRSGAGSLIASCVCAMLVASTAAAQDHNHGQAASDAWTWAAEAQVFGGFNYQRREFTDFDAWESQNWVMGSAARRRGPWQFHVSTMLSAEPFTVADIGSPQAFQTGETFRNAPLIDYQHPHDLIMQLGGEALRTSGRTDRGARRVAGRRSATGPARVHAPCVGV